MLIAIRHGDSVELVATEHDEQTTVGAVDFAGNGHAAVEFGRKCIQLGADLLAAEALRRGAPVRYPGAEGWREQPSLPLFRGAA